VQGEKPLEDAKDVKAVAEGDAAGARFFKKAQSQMLSVDGRKLQLFKAFQYFAGAASAGTDYWINKLRGISMGEVEAILDRVRDNLMSQPAKAFAKLVLEYNQTKLLETWTTE
jgi:hypothetical protein